MNRITQYIKFFSLASILMFGACTEDYTESFLANSPVYLSYEELRSAVRFDSPKEITKPGRIYFKGDTLFVVEAYAGVHVLKVNNPANPENAGFITIPGCTDLSIRNNILLANSFIDLVAIDISDLSNIRETARAQSAFQYCIPQKDNEYPYANIDETKGVVVDLEVRKIEQEVELYPSSHPYYYYNISNWDGAYLDNMSSGGGKGSASFGTGGSMATFGLYDHYLYILKDFYEVVIYDVSSPSKIDKINNTRTSAQAETMFLYDGHMFLGTTTGVSVFNLSAPSSPKHISTYSHLTACDPVVIQDGYAYYTLRSGTDCRTTGINRLDILKLSDDYRSNELIATYSMKEPYGLGIDANTLFVCDGDAGLKIYDVADKTKLSQNKLAEFPSIHAYDVIPMKGYLFTIGKGGFFLYDYTDIKNIKQIASIPVKTAE